MITQSLTDVVAETYMLFGMAYQQILEGNKAKADLLICGGEYGMVLLSSCPEISVHTYCISDFYMLMMDEYAKRFEVGK